MKQSIVFFRTKLGNQILGVEYGSLGGDARRVLAMIDGKTTVDEIIGKVPHSVQVLLDQIYARLLSAGLIRVKAVHAEEVVSKTSDDIEDAIITQKLAKVTQSQNIAKYSQGVDPQAKQIMELEFQLADVRARLSASGEHQRKLEKTCQKLEQQVAEYEQSNDQNLPVHASKDASVAEATGTLDTLETWNQTLSDQKEIIEKTLKLHSFKEQLIVDPRKAPKDHPARQTPPHASPHYKKLRGLEFFKGFANADLLDFLNYIDWQTVAAGEAILQEGESGLYYFIIVSGSVKVTRKSRMMATLGVGDFFGEFAYLSGDVPLRTARVEAETDCELLKVEPMEVESASLQVRLHVVEALLRGLARRSLMSSHRIDSMLNHLDIDSTSHDSR
ncbi:MAG: cyclic nucleotide-binding domain-containing protein [Gallionella sp.]